MTTSILKSKNPEKIMRRSMTTLILKFRNTGGDIVVYVTNRATPCRRDDLGLAQARRGVRFLSTKTRILCGEMDLGLSITGQGISFSQRQSPPLFSRFNRKIEWKFQI